MLKIFLGKADGNIDDVCPQSKLADYSGVDSLVAPAVCGLTLILFQLLPCVPTESKSWWFTKASGATHRVAGRRATQHTRTQQTGCTPILAPFRWSLSNLSKGEARPRRPRPAAASRPKPPDDETARRETTALGLLFGPPASVAAAGRPPGATSMLHKETGGRAFRWSWLLARAPLSPLSSPPSLPPGSLAPLDLKVLVLFCTLIDLRKWHYA